MPSMTPLQIATESSSRPKSDKKRIGWGLGLSPSAVTGWVRIVIVVAPIMSHCRSELVLITLDPSIPNRRIVRGPFAVRTDAKTLFGPHVRQFVKKKSAPADKYSPIAVSLGDYDVKVPHLNQTPMGPAVAFIACCLVGSCDTNNFTGKAGRQTTKTATKTDVSTETQTDAASTATNTATLIGVDTATSSPSVDTATAIPTLPPVQIDGGTAITSVTPSTTGITFDGKASICLDWKVGTLIVTKIIDDYFRFSGSYETVAADGSRQTVAMSGAGTFSLPGTWGDAVCGATASLSGFTVVPGGSRSNPPEITIGGQGTQACFYVDDAFGDRGGAVIMQGVDFNITRC